jgi:hypothetical protein
MMEAPLQGVIGHEIQSREEQERVSCDAIGAQL